MLQTAGATGDGYFRKEPLTPYEEFHGLSLGRLVLGVDSGLVPLASLRFLVDVADSARLLVARQFGLSELHSSYTHLVARRHIPGVGQNRSTSDLSHSIHVDNCLLTPNGTCSQGKGAYIHRHYSAILYLNSDFTGGEFVFADNIVNRRPTVRVKPRCGRLVGFSAGPENPHGVLAVTGGARYALAMWYTLDAQRREDEKMVAEMYLHNSSMPEVRLMVSIMEKKFQLVDKIRTE